MGAKLISLLAMTYTRSDFPSSLACFFARKNMRTIIIGVFNIVFMTRAMFSIIAAASTNFQPAP